VRRLAIPDGRGVLIVRKATANRSRGLQDGGGHVANTVEDLSELGYQVIDASDGIAALNPRPIVSA